MSETKQSLAEFLFEAASQKLDPAERNAFLDGVCRDDPALRARLDLLLEGHFQGEGFLTKNREREAKPIEPPPPEPPSAMVGRYKLLEKIGEGGFGEVWMAEQKEPVKRRVALKILKLGMDTRQVVGRFEAERQALALMDHPNIARVLDAGATDTGRPYFVMDLVRGIKITDYCDQNNLPTQDRLDLFIKVCQAIQHAHQKGIIHRDIKPSNILVTLHDGVPVPKVIDFGIAKATQQELTDKTLFTQFQQFLGTPAYMSPEQAEMSGLDMDTRSDIYSLGVLLYELLVGRTPFDAKELMQGGLEALRQMIREKEPLRPSTRLNTLNGEDLTTTARRRQTDAPKLLHLLRGDLDWIVMKCLEKDRTRRYETANGLVMDLKRYLSGEPVTARPPSTMYRVGKFVRRNKVLVGAASAVALALVLGIVVSTWQATVATRARSVAERARGAETRQRLAAESAEKQADAERLRAERQLYAANMNLVQREWEQNNVGRMRQLLDETAAYQGRGFEWYYWRRQAHREVMTLRGHNAKLGFVAYSPDGRQIAATSGDMTANVWDAESGKELLTLKGHTAVVGTFSYSPDAQRIVTGSSDGTAKVWEAAIGKDLLTLTGHFAAVCSAAYSPDGQRIATASWDQTARVWEAATGKELVTYRGHDDRVMSVAFSPDSKRVVTGSWDHTAKVWDAANGRELLNLKGHTAPIRSVAFSPDGQRIVTSSEDWTAKVWDAATGRELLTLKGHNHAIRPAAFSPDGRRIVTGSHDQTARVWDAVTGEELLTLRGHTAGIRGVGFSPDGQRIVTGSEDGTAKVWEARDRFTLRGHRDVISSVAFSPDGQRMVTSSLDQTAKVWEVASGKELLSLEGHHGGIRSLAFSPDGRWIVTGSWDRTARVWDATGGRQLLLLAGHHGGIRSVAFSPDGQRIVTGSEDHMARLWGADSGKELLTLSGHTGGIRGVTFSPDGQRILTGSEDKTAKVWDASSGKELFPLKGHTAAINSVAFAPDGQRIVTGSGNQTASQRVVTDSEECTAKVWEAAGGRHLLTLKGHSAAINSVAFSRDGQRIITGSGDQTAKLWEVASGSELLTLKGHDNAISSVAFSPEGHRIVTGSWDRTARVWEAATASQVATWLREEKAASEHLVLLRNEQLAVAEEERPLRAQDSAAIKKWLVLAPIPYEAPSGTAALAQEQIAHEAQLRPKAGERVKVGERELAWTEVQMVGSLLDFTQLLGTRGHSNVAYAVCYLQAEARQTGLLLEVGSMDMAKVYLNRNEIHRDTWSRGPSRRPDSVQDVGLNAGLNVVVFKVLVELGPAWDGSVWLTDATGQPPKGIRVTLDPDGMK